MIYNLSLMQNGRVDFITVKKLKVITFVVCCLYSMRPILEKFSCVLPVRESEGLRPIGLK
jgi:hypothetical protein